MTHLHAIGGDDVERDFLLVTPGRGRPLYSIMIEVCKAHGITHDELISRRHARALAAVRQEAYWRCKNETDASLPEIGRAFGGRDHTTILFGIRRHEERTKAGKNGA